MYALMTIEWEQEVCWDPSFNAFDDVIQTQVMEGEVKKNVLGNRVEINCTDWSMLISEAYNSWVSIMPSNNGLLRIV